MARTRHLELTVRDMTCQHCIDAIARVIEAHTRDKPIKPIHLKFVDLDSDVVALEVWEQFDSTELESLIREIEAQGYDVVDVQEIKTVN